MPTRQIWNQHSYHITNVNDDGTIPRFEQNSWQTHNTYRLNLRTEPGGPLAAPDLISCYLRVVTAGQTTTLTGRVGNGGAIQVVPGIKVAFYNGNPTAGGTLLGVVQTTKRIVPGDFEDVSLVLTNVTVGDVWMDADYSLIPASTRAGGYEFASFDVPNARWTVPLGINTAGQVVGDANFPPPIGMGEAYSAFLRSGGVFSTFTFPGSTSSEANGVNDRGQIVGTYGIQGAGFRGFLTTTAAFGTTTLIDVPGAVGTVLGDINEAGDIVGMYDSGGNNPHGFLRTAGGSFVTLDYPGAVHTWAYGNNDLSQIAGNWRVANGGVFSPGTHAWIRASPGQFMSFDVPLAAATIATGINGAGQVTGSFLDANGRQHGYLRDAAGAFTPIDVLGSIYTEARNISNAGHITGTWQDSAGQSTGIYHGFVATPVGTVRECDENNNLFSPNLVIGGVGSVSGTVFDDANGNGGQDAVEPGLAGWIVYLDHNRNNRRDPTEIFATSAANGRYTFTNL